MDEDESLFELLHLIESFNQMLSDKTVRYYDVDQFEALSDYFYDMGKINKALMVVQMAAEQHPGTANFLARKVQFLTAANKTQEAKKAMEDLEREAPDSYELHMSRASLQSKQHNHQKAIYHFKQALKHTEYPEDVWPLIAMEHQLLGQPAKAVGFLKRTLAANPEDEVGLYHIATCFELLEHFEEGARYFEEFVNQYPYSEIAWYQLGVMNEKIDDHEKALWAFEYAYLIDEWFMAPYFEKAKILEYHFRFDEALKVYQLALENDEENSYIFYRMGLCYLKLHRRLKADRYFTKAIQNDADFEEAYTELALLKDEDEDWSQAVFYAQKLLELEPTDTEFLQLNARIHRRAGRLEEAELLYEKMAENGYSEPDLYIDWAELLFDMCEFDNGMEVLYEGVALNSNSADMHFRLSGYLFTLQESDEATIYFKKALALNADKRILFFELFPKLKQNQTIQNLVANL